MATADLMAALWSSSSGFAVREGQVRWLRVEEDQNGRGGGGNETRRLGRTHVQNTRSGHAQSMHARRSAKCQHVLESLGGAGN